MSRVTSDTVWLEEVEKVEAVEAGLVVVEKDVPVVATSDIFRRQIPA